MAESKIEAMNREGNKVIGTATVEKTSTGSEMLRIVVEDQTVDVVGEGVSLGEPFQNREN